MQVRGIFCIDKNGKNKGHSKQNKTKTKHRPIISKCMGAQQLNTLSFVSGGLWGGGRQGCRGMTQVVLLTSRLPRLTDSWHDFYVTGVSIYVSLILIMLSYVMGHGTLFLVHSPREKSPPMESLVGETIFFPRNS